MVIFPLAPDQTIAQMWSNGARGVQNTRQTNRQRQRQTNKETHKQTDRQRHRPGGLLWLLVCFNSLFKSWFLVWREPFSAAVGSQRGRFSGGSRPWAFVSSSESASELSPAAVSTRRDRSARPRPYRFTDEPLFTLDGADLALTAPTAQSTQQHSNQHSCHVISWCRHSVEKVSYSSNTRGHYQVEDCYRNLIAVFQIFQKQNYFFFHTFQVLFSQTMTLKISF